LRDRKQRHQSLKKIDQSLVSHVVLKHRSKGTPVEWTEKIALLTWRNRFNNSNHAPGEDNSQLRRSDKMMFSIRDQKREDVKKNMIVKSSLASRKTLLEYGLTGGARRQERNSHGKIANTSKKKRKK